MAVLLTLSVDTRSATGIVFKTITVGLLTSGAVLGEGFICILLAAPHFYLVGLLPL
jgi:hypothetical protein